MPKYIADFLQRGSISQKLNSQRVSTMSLGT